MVALDRLTQLSAPRQALVRLFQSVNFGQVIRLAIRNGDPVFHPEPTVLLDVKLDADEGERPEAGLPDFTLNAEVRRLLAHLDHLQNGTLDRIDIRSGVPRRIIIERRIREGQR